MASSRAPEAPADFDPVAKRLWKRTIADLRAQGTWESSDAGALERYVRATERARHAREAREGSLVTSGSTGQVVPHPNLRTEREADRDAHDYARELLLTPAARRRHEIEVQREGGTFGGRV